MTKLNAVFDMKHIFLEPNGSRISQPKVGITYLVYFGLWALKIGGDFGSGRSPTFTPVWGGGLLKAPSEEIKYGVSRRP